METENKKIVFNVDLLSEFFNKRPQDIIVCTASVKGDPNVTVMGSPKVVENGNIEFAISEAIPLQSITFQNIKENRNIVFMVVIPGERASDYKGVRIYCEVKEIITFGEKIESFRSMIKERHGEEKASELVAIVICNVKQIRPIVDRGQNWENYI